MVSLIGFTFVDDADLVTAANNAYTPGVEMIQKMHHLWLTGALVFEPLAASLPQLKLDGSFFSLSRTEWIGSTTQKIPFQAT